MNGRARQELAGWSVRRAKAGVCSVWVRGVGRASARRGVVEWNYNCRDAPRPDVARCVLLVNRKLLVY